MPLPLAEQPPERANGYCAAWARGFERIELHAGDRG